MKILKISGKNYNYFLLTDRDGALFVLVFQGYTLDVPANDVLGECFRLTFRWTGFPFRPQNISTNLLAFEESSTLRIGFKREMCKLKQNPII